MGSGKRFPHVKQTNVFGPAKYMPSVPGTFTQSQNFGVKWSTGKRFSAQRTTTPGPGMALALQKGFCATIGAGSRFPQLSRREKELKRMGRMDLVRASRAQTSHGR